MRPDKPRHCIQNRVFLLRRNKKWPLPHIFLLGNQKVWRNLFSIPNLTKKRVFFGLFKNIYSNFVSLFKYSNINYMALTKQDLDAIERVLDKKLLSYQGALIEAVDFKFQKVEKEMSELRSEIRRWTR